MWSQWRKSKKVNFWSQRLKSKKSKEVKKQKEEVKKQKVKQISPWYWSKLLWPWTEMFYSLLLLFVRFYFFTLLLFTVVSFAPLFYLFFPFYMFTCCFIPFYFWGISSKYFTSLPFDFWAKGSNITVALHLLTKPQLRNRSHVDPKRRDSRFWKRFWKSLA